MENELVAIVADAMIRMRIIFADAAACSCYQYSG